MEVINSIIEWIKTLGWVDTAFGVFIPMAVAAIAIWQWARRRVNRPRSFLGLVKSKLQLPYPMARMQSIAQVAIVDDNLSDFPIQELRRAGFHIKTYKHVAVSDFDDLAQFDVVFLDMHDIVRDDPTEGGLKLIRVLRQKNSMQKICAVSGNQFNPSATAFFKLADDTLNKPMSAQRCVEVLEAFLQEKLDPQVIAERLDVSPQFQAAERKEMLRLIAEAAAQRHVIDEASIPSSLSPECRTSILDLSRALAAP